MKEFKKCKGHGRAKGFNGCGKEVKSKYRRFGLCSHCLWEWACTNENGKVWRETQFIPRIKKITEKEQRKKSREEKKKKKIELMTVDKYRKKYVQPIINEIAREIDYGHACIATGNFGKMNGGHYLSVGANRTTAYNLHNIFIQSFESNTFRGGDDKNYQYGLKEIFGERYFDFVHGLRRCPALHLTKDDLREVKKNANIVLKRLKENRKIRHPEERVRERNRANKVIGIYPDEYGTFRLEKLELDSTKQ